MTSRLSAFPPRFLFGLPPCGSGDLRLWDLIVSIGCRTLCIIFFGKEDPEASPFLAGSWYLSPACLMLGGSLLHATADQWFFSQYKTSK